jgi:hypothetical protein
MRNWFLEEIVVFVVVGVVVGEQMEVVNLFWLQIYLEEVFVVVGVVDGVVDGEQMEVVNLLQIYLEEVFVLEIVIPRFGNCHPLRTKQ